ncbi:carbohydrate ABC transporter permease [Egibacter rhizosphaerae]|uniref:Carbohydrate ABC transporter permease n=1 Tax=Egibacter rhizosphaerae TaxID=1670831 RepID=A0A411YK27_9ACTN|nr:carbohydrate ABC transporter permease [Egibacter rhizosphaerae]QBI21564.1 carbohydrate ABC transporter permease [Egibacter rhizosphaerae]
MIARLALPRVALYALLGLFAVFVLVPVYLMVVTSLKSPAEAILSRMWHLPGDLSLDAWRSAFATLRPYLVNSFQLAVPATVLSAFLGSLNGFVFARWRFPGSEIVFNLVLFGLFIPYQIVLIPLVVTMQSIGLYNSIGGLVLVHVIYGIPITTLIFRNFYARIPQELLDAAKVDGAGVLSLYWRIAVPLSLPGFVVVGIWQFTQVWNEFLWAVTLTSAGQRPVMVALQNLSGAQIVEWNVQMAAALQAALPTLIVYVLLGRYFVRGLLAGALKE